MEWQYLLYSFTGSGADLEGDAGTRPLLAPLEFESEFDEEQFIEDQTDVRRRTGGLKIGETFSWVRPVDFRQRFAASDQAEVGTHCGRNWIGRVRPKIIEGPANDPPEPARSQFSLSGGFVNRNDAADFERGGGFFLGIVGAPLFIDVAENLKLGLDDLEFAVAILLDLAVEGDHLPSLETVAQISSVEPEAFEPVACLADCELKYRHTPSPEE